MLEAMLHPSSVFATLTYDDQHLPSNLSLVPSHPQKWMKRLRRATPNKIRFYLVGEYGTKGKRGINPHYHVALFGSDLADEPIILKTWGKGSIHVGDITPASAQYICGYVTKKLTTAGDPILQGRYPEFARMSNRPGIGAHAMQIIGEHLFHKFNVQEILKTGDVPQILQHGRKKLPLGQYLRTQLRNHIGMPDEFKNKATYQYSQEMCALLALALTDPANKSKSFSQIIAETNGQKILQAETRFNIYSQERTL